MPQFPPSKTYHEDRLRSTINAAKAYRELDLHLETHEMLLIDYYLGKNRHPDDVNETINKWDTIQP